MVTSNALLFRIGAKTGYNQAVLHLRPRVLTLAVAALAAATFGSAQAATDSPFSVIFAPPQPAQAHRKVDPKSAPAHTFPSAFRASVSVPLPIGTHPVGSSPSLGLGPFTEFRPDLSQPVRPDLSRLDASRPDLSKLDANKSTAPSASSSATAPRHEHNGVLRPVFKLIHVLTFGRL